VPVSAALAKPVVATMLSGWIIGKLDIESCGPPSRANFLFARDS